MPKQQAVNPRRFSRSELDDNEPMVMHIALKAQHGSEETCVQRLRLLLSDHPTADVTITGIGTVDGLCRITIGINLGGFARTLNGLPGAKDESPQAAAGLALVRSLFHAMFDFWPKFTSPPPPAEAHGAELYGRPLLAPKTSGVPVTARAAAPIAVGNVA